MNKKNLLLLISCILSGWISISAQSITVDYAAQHQTITMIGADMERSASFLQSAANPQEIANWCYQDIENMVCRVSYDKKQELIEGTTNFAFYDNAIASMKMVKIANPDVKFWATMKSDYNGYNGQNNLPDWICDYKPTTRFDTDKYGVFLADYLELMHDNGVTISYISVSKEWSVITVDRAHQIIQKVNSECSSRGVPQPMYASPASWAVSQGVSYVESVGSKSGYADMYTAFSSHNLNKQSHLWDEFVDACTIVGKPAYCDESGNAGGGRTNGEEPETIGTILGVYSEKATMYAAGLQGELIFEVWSRGVSSETRNIYFTSGTEGKRMRSYYVMKNFANHIYQRKYLSSSTTSISDVETMAFGNDNEIALWVINSSTSDYAGLDLNINNASVNGKVYQYAWDIDTKIYGEASILTPDIFKNYSCDIKAQSINLFVIQLTEPTTLDEISADTDNLDFGTVNIGGSEPTSKTLYVTVDEPSTDVSLAISGFSANQFSINGNTSYSSESATYAIPVEVIFTPNSDGEYSANLTITSGSKSKTIALSGEGYESEIVDIPFSDYFSTLVPGSTLTTSDINSFSDYKGWQVHNGLSSGATRMNVTTVVGDDDIGYFLTPEINFDGPFELSFYARMKLNNVSTTLTQNENNQFRNFYAVIGNDTIYDHHKNGSTLFQNYNKWKCRYSYEGKARIKFFAITQEAGDWIGKTDGLTFGANNESVSVLETSSPTVNMAFGESIDLGEVTKGSTGSSSFNLKGWNLSSGLTFTQSSSNKATISSLSYSPDFFNEINETISVSIDASELELGTYAEKVFLNSSNSEIKQRTIWLNYEVTSATSIKQIEYKHNVYVQFNHVTVDAAYITDVEVFSIGGQKIKDAKHIDHASFNLNNGIYLIKVDHEVHKIVVSN
ncbi:hypothetical protein [Saccharicrinis sp. 156]|uniref:hypothetical protein n=1 Tax=Saccharicrinis sp. 156 TaxID=3417574 RepID=UPI003D339B82